jgi:hypothetical protein
MRRVIAIGILVVLAAPAFAQTRKPPAKKPAAPPPPATKKETPEVTCPTPLGVGVKTKTAFCDVMTGRDPAGGVLIKLPPHRGPVTLSFDLHNRHMYSEEQVKARRAYARYTATIGVLTMDNTLLTGSVEGPAAASRRSRRPGRRQSRSPSRKGKIRSAYLVKS